MYIDRILFPVQTLGPGNRIVVWTKGCTKHCPHCANPELWDARGAKRVTVADAAQIIRNLCRENRVEGITFTGGDPLEQPEALLELLWLIRQDIKDILVYTGYTFEQLQLLLPEEDMQALQQRVSVLIDGPYIDALNDGCAPLMGSSNQRILFFDKELEPRYGQYLKEGRKIQNVLMGDQFISVGIHSKKRDGYHEE